MIRARRRALPQGERAISAQRLARAADAVPRLPGARCLAGYMAMDDEPDCGVLQALLLDRGVTVLLPRVLRAGEMGFAAVTRTPLGALTVAPGATTVSRRRIVEPTGPPVALRQAEVVLLPATAVDLGGVRLGQGGGYYDRALADLPATGRPLLVAVVYDDEVLPAGQIPRDDHDVLVDGMLTPSGYRAASRG